MRCAYFSILSEERGLLAKVTDSVREGVHCSFQYHIIINVVVVLVITTIPILAITIVSIVAIIITIIIIVLLLLLLVVLLSSSSPSGLIQFQLSYLSFYGPEVINISPPPPPPPRTPVPYPQPSLSLWSRSFSYVPT